MARTGLGSPSGFFQHFVLEVPANATNLSFVISGGTGDADLYVRRGDLPTLTTFDCRPFLDGNSERCDFAIAEGGSYFVSLHAFDSFSGVALIGQFTNPTFPRLELERTGISAARDQFAHFELAVPEGAARVTFQISGGTGDADLYVRRGSQPTTTEFDCRPFLDGNDEICTVDDPVADTYFIGVRAVATFSGVTLVGDIE